MSGNDDNWPVKFVGGKVRTTARKMSGRVIDSSSFERRILGPLDGNHIVLETKGGMPRVEVVEVSPESVGIPSGVAVQIDTGKDEFVLKVSSGEVPLKVGVINPPQYVGTSPCYAIYKDKGGLATRKGNTWNVFWFKTLFMLRSKILGWKRFKRSKVETSGEFVIPFKTAFEQPPETDYKWASETEVNGEPTMTLPTRSVYLSSPNKPYTPLPPAVSDVGEVVQQCCDAQTFVDRRAAQNGVVTDLTKYYHTVVWSGGATSAVDEKLFLAVGTNVAGWSNADGATLDSLYPCVSYRVWALTLDEAGNGLPFEEQSVQIQSAFGGTPIHPSIRADFTDDWTAESRRERFTKTIRSGTVVDVVYVGDVTYKWHDEQVAQWSNIGQPYMFDSAFGWAPGNPGFAILGREREKCTFNSTESVSVSSGVEVGGDFYEFFSASGESYFTADKTYEFHGEGFHQGSLPEDQAYGDGNTFTSVIEQLSGHSVGEMIGWTDAGSIKLHDSTKTDASTDLVTSATYTAKQRHYLIVDSTLGFSAYLEFSMSFSISVNSAEVSTEFKWTIPKKPKKVPVTCAVKLCVRHGEYASDRELVTDVLTITPPVQVKTYTNIYYLTDLTWDGPRAWRLIANDADVTHKYKLPSFEPQPSYFNSVDLLMQSQQTVPHIAGFRKDELKDISENLSETLIASRKFKICDLAADGMFANYGIDAPLSTSLAETDPAKTRPYGYSPALYELIYQTEINFQYDNIRRENVWLADFSDNEKVHPQTDSSELTATCFRV